MSKYSKILDDAKNPTKIVDFIKIQCETMGDDVDYIKIYSDTINKIIKNMKDDTKIDSDAMKENFKLLKRSVGKLIQTITTIEDKVDYI